MDVKQTLIGLSSLMTVSGCETLSENALRKLVPPFFDEYRRSAVGSHMFIRHSANKNAKKIMLEAHYDEIGMLVSSITEEGFLRVINVGGLDMRTLPASEVTIYGTENITGVIVSTPPHLQKPGESKKLPEIADILIDTGYTADELKGIVDIGTPVGFRPVFTELENGRISGKSFDNKACAAAVLRTAELIGESDYDIIVLLSSCEEISAIGAMTASQELMPDVAFVLDVDFGDAPDVKKSCSGKLGEGPTICYTGLLDRPLTDSIAAYADAKGLKYQVNVSVRSTGTDGDIIPLTAYGVPAALLGIPLRNMHTAAEIIDLNDIESTASLIAGYVKEGINAWMNN